MNQNSCNYLQYCTVFSYLVTYQFVQPTKACFYLCHILYHPHILQLICISSLLNFSTLLIKLYISKYLPCIFLSSWSLSLSHYVKLTILLLVFSFHISFPLHFNCYCVIIPVQIGLYISHPFNKYFI